MHGIFGNCTGFLAIARDFWQLHGIFFSCTGFLAIAREFWQLHGIFFSCTGFLAIARGFCPMHGIFFNCTGFLAIARDFRGKYAVHRQMHEILKEKTGFLPGARDFRGKKWILKGIPWCGLRRTVFLSESRGVLPEKLGFCQRIGIFNQRREVFVRYYRRVGKIRGVGEKILTG